MTGHPVLLSDVLSLYRRHWYLAPEAVTARRRAQNLYQEAAQRNSGADQLGITASSTDQEVPE